MPAWSGSSVPCKQQQTWKQLQQIQNKAMQKHTPNNLRCVILACAVCQSSDSYVAAYKARHSSMLGSSKLCPDWIDPFFNVDLHAQCSSFCHKATTSVAFCAAPDFGIKWGVKPLSRLNSLSRSSGLDKDAQNESGTHAHSKTKKGARAKD